ncbi:N-acetylmuramic acid 6-phosphate etherase [Selenomonas sp.]|uniref:N-acetylmuramic acid 6-phosphate etherase n=1 Tax=Selenomonas sp. TaxID=2053611 RepID=UPI003FA239CD
MIDLDKLTTEQRNAATLHIDELPIPDMLRTIHEEDKNIIGAVESALPMIARAVEIIAVRLKKGGRLFYLGAGTSGRLGILDAVECPPTFSTDPSLVQGVIAGGTDAVFHAQEGAEDSLTQAQEDLQVRGFCAADVLCGVAASGRTPYVIGGLGYAKSLKAATIAVACTPDSPIAALADIAITAVTGPEVITGSTRLKAGTAQKIILNMLSTGTMIRLGKVYGNLMVDVKVSNDKLKERARRIVMEATGKNLREAEEALTKAAGSAKLAVFMLLANLSAEEARVQLANADGYIGRALKGESS